MNILLTGASGFVGRNLTAVLQSLGHRIQPASRRTGVDFNRLLSPADWAPRLAGIDAVINAVGIIGETRRQRFETLHAQAPMALFRACADAGVRRVVQISALGADHTAFSSYHLSKRAADDCLRVLDLDWFVLRPSLIFGRGGGSAGLFMRLARLPRIPVIGDGQQRLQPIHIGDLVATVVRSLETNETRQTIDVAGGETIAFGDWLQSMRLAQGLPPTPLVHIPYGLATALSHAARHVLPLLQPDTLRMLRAGCHADHRPLAKFLGRAPAAPTAEHFFTDALNMRR